MKERRNRSTWGPREQKKVAISLVAPVRGWPKRPCNFLLMNIVIGQGPSDEVVADPWRSRTGWSKRLVPTQVPR